MRLMVGRTLSTAAPRWAGTPASSGLTEGMNHGLVSVEWLAAHQAETLVVDCSWFLPGVERSPKAEFARYRIPGARFFDVDTVVDQTSGLPHSLPSSDTMAAACSALGIEKEATPVVVYDSQGIFSAPRLWWMLRLFGHTQVAVLDGGLPAFIKRHGADAAASMADGSGGLVVDGGSLASLSPSPGNETWGRVGGGGAGSPGIWDLDDVLHNITAQGAQLVDARSRGRFEGTTAEPREGMRGGHIPGSISLPFSDLLVELGNGNDDDDEEKKDELGICHDNGDGTVVTTIDIGKGTRFKPIHDLEEVFTAAGVDTTTPVTTTCGSGMTACIVSLGLYLATAGRAQPVVYDGSWTEWGSRADTPVAKGAAAGAATRRR